MTYQASPRETSGSGHVIFGGLETAFSPAVHPTNKDVLGHPSTVWHPYDGENHLPYFKADGSGYLSGTEADFHDHELGVYLVKRIVISRDNAAWSWNNQSPDPAVTPVLTVLEGAAAGVVISDVPREILYLQFGDRIQINHTVTSYELHHAVEEPLTTELYEITFDPPARMHMLYVPGFRGHCVRIQAVAETQPDPACPPATFASSFPYDWTWIEASAPAREEFLITSYPVDVPGPGGDTVWRPAREDELYFDYGSYDGNGVITLGGIEVPWRMEAFLETEAPNVRVTVLSYEELDTVSGIEQGSMYQAARIAVFDMHNDPVIYNRVFGDEMGNLAAGQLPPVMEWHDSENQVEASTPDTYIEINPTLYSGDSIAPIGWFIRLLIEFDDGDGGSGGGGGECFWTDLKQVMQVCGDPGPGPDPETLLDVPVLIPSGLHRSYNAPNAALTLGFTTGPVLDPGVSAVDVISGVPYSSPHYLNDGSLSDEHTNNIALTHIAFLGVNVGSHELPGEPYSEDPEFYSRLRAAIMQMPVAAVAESGWGRFTQYDEMPAVLASNGSLRGVGRNNDPDWSGFITSGRLALYIQDASPDYWPTVGDLFAVRAEDGGGASAIIIMVIAESDYNDYSYN